MKDLDHRAADHDLEIGSHQGGERGRRAGTPGRTSLVEAERWPEPPDAQRAAVHAAVSSLGAGAPLAPKYQQDYGARLGVDLGGVRVHTGNAGAQSLGALAFTHGSHVAVAPGVDLDSPAGEHVLAHELVHVAQNMKSGGSAMRLAALLDVGPSDSPVEQEAEHGAAALLSGRTFQVAMHGKLPGISMYQGPLQHNPFLPLPGGSHAGSPAMDGKVRAEFERRADPTRKALLGRGVAQVDILRIQALQYTFSPSGITEMIKSSLWPFQTVKDHFLGISSTNPYDEGSLLAWIESIRSVMRVLGDLASWISAILDIVAMVTGLLAAVTSWTVFGGIGFGALAEISAGAATIAGLIKVALDVLDGLLGVIQIFILIFKIQRSKDPGERAKLAALLGREVNLLASTATAVVVQVATIAATAGFAAGVASAFSKSLKGVRSELAKAFKGEINVKHIGAEIREKLKPTPRTPVRETTDPSTISKEEFEGGAVVARRTESRLKNSNAKRPRGSRRARAGWWKKGVPTDVRVMSADEIPKLPKDTKRVKHQQVLIVDHAKMKKKIKLINFKQPSVDASGIGVANAGTAVQGSLSATKGSTQAPGTTPTPAAGSSLSRVEMWPSMLEKLTSARAQLPGAGSHMMRQYERAQDQAGKQHAAEVRTVLGATKNAAGQYRFKSVQQEADARAGAANAEHGSANAKTGEDKTNQKKSTEGQLDSQTGKLGGAKVEVPKAKSGGLLDKAKDWVVDHTIGKIASAAGALQKTIATMVGKWAMAKAGLTKDELDMAGIDDTMRSDAKKDHKSEADAKAAQAEAAKVDPAVAALMQNATESEQIGIQAMVDAQEFLTAIDEAQLDLTLAIAQGTAYVNEVKPIIEHELEVQKAKKTIDHAYVATGLAAAAAFKRAAHGEKDVSGESANEFKDVLRSAKDVWPDLDIDTGNSQIDTARNRYVERGRAAATRADAAADATTSVLNGLVGTTNYQGVTNSYAALDAAMAAYDAFADASMDAFAADLNAIVAAYDERIDDSLTPQQIDVPADDDPRHGHD